ncbi:MAG: hypothetical protein ABEJ03_06300 [Candidatus Nanohaloarchaea archaeon]
MPRKNVSISDKHVEMLETLEETGVARELFGKSWKSAMYQHIIEKVYRERFEPEAIELEKKQLELERTSQKQERLEKEVEELREELSSDNNPQEVDEEVEEFFKKLIKDVADKVKSSRKDFTEQYESWEKGRLRQFNKKFYKIDRQQFRRKAKEKAEKLGYELKVETLESAVIK